MLFFLSFSSLLDALREVAKIGSDLLSTSRSLLKQILQLNRILMDNTALLNDWTPYTPLKPARESNEKKSNTHISIANNVPMVDVLELVKSNRAKLSQIEAPYGHSHTKKPMFQSHTPAQASGTRYHSFTFLRMASLASSSSSNSCSLPSPSCCCSSCPSPDSDLSLISSPFDHQLCAACESHISGSDLSCWLLDVSAVLSVKFLSIPHCHSLFMCTCRASMIHAFVAAQQLGVSYDAATNISILDECLKWLQKLLGPAWSVGYVDPANAFFHLALRSLHVIKHLWDAAKLRHTKQCTDSLTIERLQAICNDINESPQCKQERASLESLLCTAWGGVVASLMNETANRPARAIANSAVDQFRKIHRRVKHDQQKDFQEEHVEEAVHAVLSCSNLPMSKEALTDLLKTFFDVCSLCQWRARQTQLRQQIVPYNDNSTAVTVRSQCSAASSSSYALYELDDGSSDSEGEDDQQLEHANRFTSCLLATLILLHSLRNPRCNALLDCLVDFFHCLYAFAWSITARELIHEMFSRYLAKGVDAESLAALMGYFKHHYADNCKEFQILCWQFERFCFLLSRVTKQHRRKCLAILAAQVGTIGGVEYPLLPAAVASSSARLSIDSE